MTEHQNKYKLSCRSRNKFDQKEMPSNIPNKTMETPTKPIPNKQPYSPVFLPCTQDSLENVDVLWDWNSPHSKVNYTRNPKRIQKAVSPKLVIKKQNTSSNSSNFSKLHEELMAFRDEINVLGNDLPQLNFDESELEYNTKPESNEAKCDLKENELDRFFDDSIEHELLRISQQIEEKLEAKKPTTKFASPRNLLTKSYSSHVLESAKPDSIKKFNFNGKLQEVIEFDLNDSLDAALESVNVNDLDKKQDDKAENSNLKLKTKSLSFGDYHEATRTNIKKEADEKLRLDLENKRAIIERNRQKALAKLKAKRKPELSDSDTSPVKCSPEEIELKRLQALAKLEAKKKQEIAERNRQEALKKLEMKRRQREAPKVT